MPSSSESRSPAGRRRTSLSIPVRITVFISLTMVFALAMNMALTVLTLEKIYTSSLLSEYRVVGRYYAQKVDRSLGFGKTLEKYTGMDALMAEVNHKNPEIADIVVSSTKGKPLFRLLKPLSQAHSILPAAGTDGKEHVLERGGYYHLSFPLLKGWGSHRKVAGYFELLLTKQAVSDRIAAMIAQSARILGAVAVVSVIVFFFVVRFLIPAKGHRPRIHRIPLKTRALVATSILLILSQIGYSYFNIKDFRHRYLGHIGDKSRVLGELIQTDVNYLLKLGIPITKLIKIDGLLNDVLKNTPELADITIRGSDAKLLYRVATNPKSVPRTLPVQADSDHVILPVTQNGTTAGTIHLNVDQRIVQHTIDNLILDAGTVVVVSLLIGFELVFFLVAVLTGGKEKGMVRSEPMPAAAPNITEVPVRSAVRAAAFLYAFAMALSMSFLPMFANALYRPIASMPWLSREIVIGLPISTEMLAVAVSLIIGGYWLDRKGWLAPFVSGVVITGIGMALCGIARSTLTLMLYRACVGFGYGLALMSTQSVVVNLTRVDRRSSAVAGLEAGYFSGFISSTAVGGMLADKIGYRGVFFVGSILVLISILFAVTFLWPTRGAGKIEEATGSEKVKGPGLGVLLKDREFMGSLLLSAIPSALCLVGFLYFASLLFLTQKGVSQSNIARLMMPYGLCMVYIAPGLNRWMDAFKSKRVPVIVGGIIGGLALLSFIVLNSVPMYIVILVLFSLAGGMSYGPRIASVSESHRVQQIGVGKALGLFNSLERIGNIIGPIVVGAMITAVGMTAAISNLGLIYLVGTLFYFIAVRGASPTGSGN